MSTEKSLESITRRIIDTGDALNFISQQHCDFIRTFVEHKELIVWLRENMKGAITLNLSFTEQ